MIRCPTSKQNDRSSRRDSSVHMASDACALRFSVYAHVLWVGWMFRMKVHYLGRSGWSFAQDERNELNENSCSIQFRDGLDFIYYDHNQDTHYKDHTKQTILNTSIRTPCVSDVKLITRSYLSETQCPASRRSRLLHRIDRLAPRIIQGGEIESSYCCMAWMMGFLTCFRQDMISLERRVQRQSRCLEVAT